MWLSSMNPLCPVCDHIDCGTMNVDSDTEEAVETFAWLLCPQGTVCCLSVDDSLNYRQL